MLLQAGVYRITNIETGDFYIGASVDIPGRWAVHKNLLKKGKGVPALQRAWRKYGPWSFQYDVLLWCDRDMVTVFEQRAIDVLRPQYNIQTIAGVGGMVGRHHSEESKQKISNSMKNNRRKEASPSFLDSVDECPLSTIPERDVEQLNKEVYNDGLR